MIRGIDASSGVSRPNLEPYRGQPAPSPPQPRKKTGFAQPEPVFDPCFTPGLAIQQQKELNAAAAMQKANEELMGMRDFSPVTPSMPSGRRPAASVLPTGGAGGAISYPIGVGLSDGNMMSFAQASATEETKQLLVQAEASYLQTGGNSTQHRQQQGQVKAPPDTGGGAPAGTAVAGTVVFTPPPMPSPSPTRYQTPTAPHPAPGLQRPQGHISPDILTAVSRMSPAQIAILERSEDARSISPTSRQEAKSLQQVQRKAKDVESNLTTTQLSLQNRIRQQQTEEQDSNTNPRLTTGSESSRLAAHMQEVADLRKRLEVT